MKHVHLDLYNWIVSTVVVAFGLSPQSVFSQANHLRVLENQKGQEISQFSSNFGTIKSAYSNSVVYYTTQYPNDNKIEVYTHNVTTRENGTLKVDIPKSAKAMLSERILSFAVNKGKTVFVCTDHIFVFELHTGSSLKFEGMTENKYSFMKCLPLGEDFLLYVQYNYHPLDEAHKHVWARFDANKREVKDVKFQSEENAMFGSMVNSWIDTRGSNIVYADPLKYAITFYSDKFEPIDSIRLDELDSNEKNVSPFRSKNMFSKDAIRSLIVIDDSLNTRIRKVYYLNDSTVMALIMRPEKEALRMDYWQKMNGKWSRVQQDYSAEWFVEGESYSENNITFTDFLQNVYDLPYIGNYTFLLPYFPYIPTVSTTNFNSDADYFKHQNDAIKNNKLFFGLKTLEVVVPVR